MTWTQRYNGTVTYCASASNIPVSGPVLSGVEGYPLPITSGNILIKEGANAGCWQISSGDWSKLATPKYALVQRGSAAGPYYLPEGADSYAPGFGSD